MFPREPSGNATARHAHDKDENDGQIWFCVHDRRIDG